MTRLALCLTLMMSLSACQSIQSTQLDKSAYCKELRQQIVFNGYHTNGNRGWLERMDRPKLAESYHTAGCK
jgi:hypothetical protein